MSKQDIKKTIKDCMNCELGFSPATNTIVLLECGYGKDCKPDYIRFRTTRNENVEYIMTRLYYGMTDSGYMLDIEVGGLDTLQINA